MNIIFEDLGGIFPVESRQIESSEWKKKFLKKNEIGYCSVLDDVTGILDIDT